MDRWSSGSVNRWVGGLGRTPGARTHHSTSPPTHQFVDVTQYRDIFGLAIQKTIEGGSPAELVATANKEFQEMLDKTEK